MVALAKSVHISHVEYLESERCAATKNEYHDGTLVAMTGATWSHNLIVGRIGRKIGAQLEGGPCEVVTSDQRVRVSSCNKDFYPDVVVVCGNPVFFDAAEDTILNPSVIMEVLSPSTERYDHGGKWECYRALNTLHAYLLVSQVTCQMEIFSRTEQLNRWNYEAATDPNGTIRIPGIGCELRLAEIYAGIELEAGVEAAS